MTEASGHGGAPGDVEPGDAEPGDAEPDGAELDVGGDPVDVETYSKSKNYVYRLLAMRDYSRAELAKKLAGRDVPPALIDDLLGKFEDAGLVDDARFAESFVRAKRAGRGLARKGLAHELAAKGVAADVIETAVADIDEESEQATARELVERKAASTRGLDRQKRVRRLVGMLGRKGYPPGLSMRVIDSVLNAEEAGDDDLG